MANHTVTAPLVVLRQQDGSRVHLYQGAPVPDTADSEHVDQLVELGMLGKAETAVAAASGEAPAGPPAKSASKADWEAYARSQGATDADLDGATKDDIVAIYGDA